MNTPADTRKSRFRAALALKRKTAREWAKEQGVSASLVSRVLAEKATSRPLLQKVDAFIARHLPSKVA